MKGVMTVIAKLFLAITILPKSVMPILFGNLRSKKVLYLLLAVLKICSSVKSGVRHQQKSSLHDSASSRSASDVSSAHDQRFFLLTAHSLNACQPLARQIDYCTGHRPSQEQALIRNLRTLLESRE